MESVYTKRPKKCLFNCPEKQKKMPAKMRVFDQTLGFSFVFEPEFYNESICLSFSLSDFRKNIELQIIK